MKRTIGRSVIGSEVVWRERRRQLERHPAQRVTEGCHQLDEGSDVHIGVTEPELVGDVARHLEHEPEPRVCDVQNGS